MAFASINQASVGGGSSNALAIQSDGIFMPRLSTGQRTALALTTGDTGLTVYDFTLKNLFIWNGTAWESIPGSGDAGANGSVQYNDNGIVSGASNFIYDKATSAVSVAGDLTVDTSTLKVDSTNDRVGFGTASPAQFVHLSKSNTSTALTSPPVGNASFRIQNTSSTNNNFGSVEFYNAAGLFGASVNCQYTNQATPTNDLVFVTRGSSGGLEHYRIAADGVATWSEVGGIAGTAMTLNVTGLGIGVSPSAKLHVEGGGAQGRFSVASASDARHEYYRNSAREGLIAWDANTFQLTATQATGELLLGSGNTTRMRMNSAGDIISNVSGTAPTLATNSQMVFNLTSNTNLRISVRGTDGTTRTANITLA